MVGIINTLFFIVATEYFSIILVVLHLFLFFFSGGIVMQFGLTLNHFCRKLKNDLQFSVSKYDP